MRFSKSTVYRRSFVVGFALLSVLGAGCGGSGGVTAEGLSIDPSAPPVAEREGRELLRDFAKGQLSEMKSLRDRHTRELKDLGQQQKTALKEWEAKSTQARRDFIQANRGNGKVIRAYVKEGQLSHDALRKSMNEERRRRRDEQENHRRALKAAQEANLQIFKAYLKQGKRPPETVWPGKDVVADPSNPVAQ